MRKLSVEYGLVSFNSSYGLGCCIEYVQYTDGNEMKRTHQETHLPKGNQGEIKLNNLEVNKKYWVMVTAHNEKFSSKTAKVDFEPLNATGEITKKSNLFRNEDFS